MSINEQLEKLYTENFDRFIKERSLLGKQISSYPLLLKIDEEKWKSAEVKIMIFGQETCGWGNDNHDNTVQTIMEKYFKFYEGIKNGSVKKRAFFNGFGRAQKYIKQNSEYHDKTIEVVWNNINKIGKYVGTGIRDVTRELERESFNVISQEMEILKPHIVIFFTGPSRDGDIIHNFPNAIIERRLTEAYGKKSKKGKYAVVKGYDFKAIRLYHPSGFGKCTNVYLQHAIKDWLN